MKTLKFVSFALIAVGIVFFVMSAKAPEPSLTVWCGGLACVLASSIVYAMANIVGALEHQSDLKLIELEIEVERGRQEIALAQVSASASANMSMWMLVAGFVSAISIVAFAKRLLAK